MERSRDFIDCVFEERKGNKYGNHEINFSIGKAAGDYGRSCGISFKAEQLWRPGGEGAAVFCK